MSPAQPLRIGCVPFLNARPLIATFPHPPSLAEPAVLAEQLAAGLLDLALIPSYSALDAGWRAIDGYGIACLGEVRSVLLLRQGPRETVRTVALDQGSRTSANLLRLLFLRFWQQEVVFLPQDSPADARLWIGDRALHHRRGVPSELIDDLGAAWFDWTGLPFVFAVWAIRPGLDLPPSVADQLRAWCRTGLAARAAVTASPEELDYVTEAIRYNITPAEHRALDRFGTELADAHLARVGQLGGWI